MAEIYKSFGAMDTIASFLLPIQVTNLQALCIWTYSKAISRVQSQVKVSTISVFFLRRRQTIIDEICLPTLKHVVR